MFINDGAPVSAHADLLSRIRDTLPAAIAVGSPAVALGTIALGIIATVNPDALPIAAIMVAMPAGRRRRVVGSGGLRWGARRGIVGGDSRAGSEGGSGDSENEIAHHAASQCG